MGLIGKNDEYDENKLLFLGHLWYNITFKFKQFGCVYYKHMLAC